MMNLFMIQMNGKKNGKRFYNTGMDYVSVAVSQRKARTSIIHIWKSYVLNVMLTIMVMMRY